MRIFFGYPVKRTGFTRIFYSMFELDTRCLGSVTLRDGVGDDRDTIILELVAPLLWIDTPPTGNVRLPRVVSAASVIMVSIEDRVFGPYDVTSFSEPFSIHPTNNKYQFTGVIDQYFEETILSPPSQLTALVNLPPWNANKTH